MTGQRHASSASRRSRTSTASLRGTQETRSRSRPIWPRSTASSPRTWGARTRSWPRGATRTAPSARRRWTDEPRRIPPQVRRRDHRADQAGHRALAEALGTGRARHAHERRHGTLLPGRQQPAPRRRATGARLRRRALGHLPPDPGPGRTGQEGRARHPHPLLPGQEADRRHRRSGTSPGGTPRASASTATRSSRRRSCGSTPCSTPSRPTGCPSARTPRPSRSGRRTGRPRRSWRTWGFRSATSRATAPTTT